MDLSRLFTLDFGVVLIYLAFTLYVGMRSGKGIKTMRDYVLGEQGGYATPILVATLFATLVGSGAIMGTAEKVFAVGIIWVFVNMGPSIRYFIIARYVAPYMDRFHKKLSLGEMMGGFYGKPGQVIGGFAGAVRCTGDVAGQIVAIGYLFHYFIGLPYVWGVVIAYGIVVAYSVFGGIRAVTATDIIQFGVLVIVIPVIACKMLWHAGHYEGIYNSVPQGHFDFSGRGGLWKYLVLFFVFVMPNLDPAYVQRLLMARDAKQAYVCFNVAACLRLSVDALITLTAFAVVAVKPNLNPNLVLPYAVDTVLSVGFRGLGIAGLLAIVMSSADSYLHIGSVSFVHDVVQPLRAQRLPDDKELKLTRVTTAVLGVGAAVAAMSFANILDLVLVYYSFWIPVVMVPLLAGIWGYTASIRSFCVAVAAGAATVTAWKLGLGEVVPIDPTIPAMCVNVLVFCIMRLFDGPHNIYYDPDDPCAQVLKEKEQADVKRDVQAGKKTGVQQKLRCWFQQWRQWLTGWMFSWQGTVAFCNLRAKILNFSYTEFAVITMLCAVMPYFFWVDVNVKTVWQECVLWMHLGGGVACFLVLMRSYLPWRLLREWLPVFWVGTLAFAWPFTQTVAFLSEGGSTGSFVLWLWGTCMLVLRLDMLAARRMVVWGTLLGCLLYSVVSSVTGLQQELMTPPPLPLLLLSPVLIAAVALLPRRDEMLLRTQGVVLCVQQATNAHESKRPLINCRDRAAALERELVKLWGVLQEIKTFSPQEGQRLQGLCTGLQQQAKEIVTDSQKGIHFLADLIANTKDPLQYTPKCEVVQMKDCVDLAVRMGEFGGESARIHVDTSEDFEVVGNMGLLAHVVINAAENAVNNSEPNDRIEIRLERGENRNGLSIYNTSSTTLERDVLHVFDLDFTRTRGGSGTGLAFSKWAVQQMDGGARVWSMPSKSTCFIYDFPQVTAQRRQKAQRRSEEQDGIKQLDEALRKQREAQQARWAKA